MEFRTYFLEGLSTLDHLAVEACLLDGAAAGDVSMLFYVDAPSVVVGRNQNPWKEASAAFLDKVFRRVSGGGAVYHDEGDLNWALIVPRDSHDQEAELALVAQAVSSLGALVAPGPRGGLYLADSGAKVSGTARRFGARAVLHHGTLLLSSDLAALSGSLGGIETVEDRSLPSVPARAANLADRVGPISPPEAARAIALRICGQAPLPLPPEILEGLGFEEELVRLGADEWRFGATPPFSVKVGVGEGSPILAVVEEGRVARFSGAGLPAGFGAAFLGEAFGLGLLALMRADLHV